MDPNAILQQFLDLCNNNSGFLQCHLASNAVLEWFGRTIRGGSKIYQYYRHNLCQQYEHNFENAQKCDPIEKNPSHMQTRNIPFTDRDQETVSYSETNQEPSEECITPSQLESTSGTSKVYDLDDLGLAEIQDAVTPPQQNKKTEPDGEPALKRVKLLDDEERKNNCTKEAADCCTDHKSNYFCKKDLNFKKVANCSSMTANEVEEPSSEGNSQDIYSEVMYLESNGILRAKNKSKHRGIIGHVNNMSLDRNPSTSASEITESPNWDREANLRISYRIRKDNNHVIFVLLIYEHITRSTTIRRNLLNEFQRTNDFAKESKKKPTPPELKRKTPLKKMRLF